MLHIGLDPNLLHLEQTTLPSLPASVESVQEWNTCHESRVIRFGIIGHLGDGIILKQTKQGVALASRPDQGEFANVTVFVTSNDAASRFRLRAEECGKSDSFLLACDGVSDSFHSKRTGTIAPAVATLFKWGKLNTGGKMKAILKKNLQMTFQPRTTDNVSMALLVAD